MKQLLFIAIWACLGAFVTHKALADDYAVPINNQGEPLTAEEVGL